MKKSKLFPPFLMLFTGALSLLAMIVTGYELKSMLLVLLIVMVVFYFIGSLIQKMVAFFEKENEEKAEKEGEVIEKEADNPENKESEQA